MMLLTVLAACSNKAPDNSADAPFEIGALKSQIWIIDPDTDEEDGAGFLILSTEELSCSDVSAAGDDLDELVLEGEGLLFMLEYGSWGDSEHGQDWTGLWMGGYAYSATRGGRQLLSLAFSDSFLYFISGYYSWYGGSGTWLDVTGDTDGLQGSYTTDYWSGEFDAISCGEWHEEPRDTDRHTGWDSW